MIHTVHRPTDIRARKAPAPNKWIDSIRHGHVYRQSHTIPLQYNFTAHRNVERKCNNNLSAPNVHNRALCWVKFVCGLKLEINIFSVFRLERSIRKQNTFWWASLSIALALTLTLGGFRSFIRRRRCMSDAPRRKKRGKNNKRNPTHSYQLIFVMFVRLEFYSRLRNSCAYLSFLFLFPLVMLLITWPTFYLVKFILSLENISREMLDWGKSIYDFMWVVLALCISSPSSPLRNHFHFSFKWQICSLFQRWTENIRQRRRPRRQRR